MSYVSFQPEAVAGRGVRLFHFAVIAAASSSLLFLVTVALFLQGAGPHLYGEQVESRVLIWLVAQPGVLLLSALFVAPIARLLSSKDPRSRLVIVGCEFLGSLLLVLLAIWQWAVISS